MEGLTEVVHTVDPKRYAKCVENSKRWQYIGSGVQGRFGEVLARFVTPAQQQRIGTALAPLLS